MLATGAEVRAGRRKLFEAYPDTGPLRRELYAKHLEFFQASAICNEIATIAGNRTGKTFSAAYAFTCHMTGWYPHWWPGRKFHKPINAWACGKSGKKTREIIQSYLFGEVDNPGAGKHVRGDGMIPAEWIGRLTWQSGTTDFIDTARIQHKTGGFSTLALKSYEQGRDAFEGAKLDLCWDDEEPPMDVYNEQVLRLTPTSGGRNQEIGLMLCTFTPLEGLTEVVLQFHEPTLRATK